MNLLRFHMNIFSYKFIRNHSQNLTLKFINSIHNSIKTINTRSNMRKRHYILKGCILHNSIQLSC